MLKISILIGLIFLSTSVCAQDNTTESLGKTTKYDRYSYYEKRIDRQDKLIKLNPNNAQAYITRAGWYGIEGNYDQAIADYNMAININPNYALAYFNRGVAYGAKDNYGQAVSDYSKAIKLDLNFEYAYTFRGNIYDAKGNYDEAIADYNMAIKLDPINPFSYYARGVAYSYKDSYDQSISDFNKTIELKPSYTLAYYQRGIVYCAKGDYYQAIADLSKAINLDPSFGPSFYRRANAYDHVGKNNQAISDYSKAIESIPDLKNVLAQYNQWTSSDKFNYIQAIADFSKAIERDPNYPQAIADYNETTRVKEISHDLLERYWSQAFSALNKAIELAPGARQDKLIQITITNFRKAIETSANREFNGSEIIGGFYFLEGDYDQAISNFTNAIKFFTKNPSREFDRGIAYAKQGKLIEAINDFKNAILLAGPTKDDGLNVFLAEICSNLGQAYRDQGNLQYAIDNYTAAIKLYETFKEAYFERGFIYYKQGNFTQAVADYNKFIEIEPDSHFDIYAFYRSSPIYYYQLRFLKSVPDFLKVTAINRKIAEDHYDKGVADIKQSNYAQALADLDQTIANDPYLSQAYPARAKAFYFNKQYDRAWEDINTAEVLGVKTDPDFIKMLKAVS